MRRAVLLAGLVAGTFDITYAIVSNGLRGGVPLNAVRGVASGLLGAAAFDGSARTVALGLVLHFTIATTWAFVFYAASRSLRWMIERPFLSGPLFGALVYITMYFVVLPLSAISFRPSRSAASIVEGLAVHVFLIGLPIALIVRRARARDAAAA